MLEIIGIVISLAGWLFGFAIYFKYTNAVSVTWMLKNEFGEQQKVVATLCGKRLDGTGMGITLSFNGYETRYDDSNVYIDNYYTRPAIYVWPNKYVEDPEVIKLAKMNWLVEDKGWDSQ